MLKTRVAIIYILIASVLSSSIFGPLTARAEELQPRTSVTAPPPSVITSSAQIDGAIETLGTSGGTFYEPPATKTAVDEFLVSTPPSKTQSAEAAVEELAEKIAKTDKKNFLWSMVQATLSTAALLTIATLSKKAHDENLHLTPENQSQLEKELDGNWNIPEQALLTIPGAAVSFGVNLGLLSIYRALRSALGKSTEMGLLFKYLVAGSMASIGSQYIQGFIVSAAQEVLDHPDQFGGVSQEERGALKLLQYRAGFAYFLYTLSPMVTHTLSRSGFAAKSASEMHKADVFHAIAWKVEMAMTLILLHDSDLRNALWSHLWSQAFLQGSTAINLGFIWFAEYLSKSFIAPSAGYWEKNLKSLFVAIAVGFASSLVPNRIKDWGTAQANARAADAQAGIQEAKLFMLSKSANAEPEQNTTRVMAFLKQNLNSRQSRFIKYAYIMKLCLDRSNTVDTEQQRIKFLESPEGRAQNPPPTDWEEWVIYGVNHVVAGDFLPNNIVLHWDKTDLYFYRETYRKAVGKMLDIYREDSILLDKLQTIPLTPEVHRQVLLQQKGLEQMRYFVGRVGSTLAERWSNLATSVRYEQTRHLLEQISFWGIREDDILRTLAQQPASALSGASRP